MRPRQWVKSVIVYAALVFDGKLLNLELFLQTTVVFFAFCLISSSVYIMNDLVDMEKDRQHPRKQARPLASGRLDPRFAAVSGGAAGVTSLSAGFLVNPWVGAVSACSIWRRTWPTVSGSRISLSST
jgi:decaprenyl-phosphate phosphoribosyltransferase